MHWLKTQARQGILGQDRVTIIWSLALLVLVNITRLGYDLLNHGPYFWILKTPLDDLIPVVKPFIIPYITLNPLIYASALLFLFFRVKIFQSAALSMTLVFLISFFFYAFLQTYVERPQLAGNDFFTQLMVQTYASDNPFNDFPSLHVSLSTILAIHWWKVDRRIGLPVGLWVVLIIMSTMFVKQHYVLDVVAGLILAFGASLFFLRRIVDRSSIQMKSAESFG